MLVESLRNLVSDLFKQSEEAIPILGDGDKKEWMAYHLDKIIDEDGDALQCLLQFNLISDVVGYLEKEYKNRKDEDQDASLACEMHLDDKRDKALSNTNYLKGNNYDKRSMHVKKNDKEPAFIVEEEIVIIKDGDCGCQ